jgi:hypothetical protein
VVTDGNGGITVKSRRMVRDEKDRNLNALRQRRFKDKRKSNAPITERSQDSSSSSSKKNKNICNISLKGFEEWWEEYPKRNGVRLGKMECKKLFAFLKEEDLFLLVKATRNYANCKQVKDGYAKDPVRFLRNDFWRDFIEIEKTDDKSW